MKPIQSSVIPYSCVFIDASTSDFMAAAKSAIAGESLSAGKREELMEAIRSSFVTPDNDNPAVISLSVRTAFDAFLSLMGFPDGAEVIMSAVNIPDMTRIVEHHRLRVVPLDFESPATLKHSGRQLTELITDRTALVMIAHIYGRYNDCSELIEIAHSRGLWFIEDCAEVFTGFNNLGNPRSDLSFFSFGAIKHQTCFGGAVTKVRDVELARQLRRFLSLYPIQSWQTFLRKTLKYLLIASVLNTPTVMKPGIAFFNLIHYDHKGLFVRLLRGFPDEMITRIRAQPSDAQLRMMADRLSDTGRLRDSLALAKSNGDLVTAQLSKLTSLGIPGISCDSRGYWLYPLVVSDPGRVVTELNRLGVDAYRGASQLSVLSHSCDAVTTPVADGMMKGVVYLPVHKNVPLEDLIAQCERVAVVLADTTADGSIKSKL